MNRKTPNGADEMRTEAEAQSERSQALMALTVTRKGKLDQIRGTLREWRSQGFDQLEEFKDAIAQLLAEKADLERMMERAIASLPF
jgi:hypothetical protein